MKGTRDWCISRQLWWGHQIPAFYCDDCGETVVAKEMPCTCPKCGGSHFTQDPDTLDTWFSSALWPFSTLGWPNEDSADLKYFYPTNTLVTGYDIIGFWVSRMIFSGLAYTGKAPFDTVCIHGIVRDSQGRKMSKSLGNGIDPLEVIAQYGADALRFMLLDGSTPGNDMRYSEKKVEAARNFANKLWNATRFVLMNLPEDFTPGLPSEDKLDMSDKWVLTKLNQVAGAMTDNLDHYEMGLAAAKINSFIWDVYCDWFIEIAKPRLNSGDAEQADTARRVLVYVLDKALKLLHPFMPFITEELYQALPGSAETIMTQSWPTFDEAHNWADEEEAFEKVMDYIKAVRTMRTEMNVHPAKKTSMIIETADAAPFQKAQVYLAKFAFATDVTFTEKYEGSTDGMVQVSTHAARGFIPMMELIDRDKELARLNKEKAKAEKEMAMFANQLNNPCLLYTSANLLDPDGILTVHRAYLEAGADAIKTNTFGLPRMAAAQNPMWEAMADEGWKLAAQAAAKTSAAVFADLGPAPDTEALPAAQIYTALAERFAALGAKNFLFETLSSDAGVAEAAKKIKETVPDAFVLVSFADVYKRQVHPLVPCLAKALFVELVALEQVAHGQRDEV